MARLDLRALAAKEGFRLEDTPELRATDRASAIATWKGRMVNEHISARVFAGLLPQLMAADVSAERQAEVAAMITEELRHAVLCASVVEALGGEAVAELPALPPVPAHEDATPLEAVLRNVLSICCLSETVAVALIDAERRATGPAALQSLLTTIVADEVGHSRFGWTLLDELAHRIDPGLRERLDDYLVVALEHLHTHELSHLPPRAAPSEAAEAIGVCDGLEARGLFFDTVETAILPGLELRGFRARECWAAATAAAA